MRKVVCRPVPVIAFITVKYDVQLSSKTYYTLIWRLYDMSVPVTRSVALLGWAGPRRRVTTGIVVATVIQTGVHR